MIDWGKQPAAQPCHSGSHRGGTSKSATIHKDGKRAIVDMPSRCLRVYRWQTGNRAWDIANCSRLVALALDEEGLHLLVLQDLHGRLLESERVRSSSGITACSNYSFTMF